MGAIQCLRREWDWKTSRRYNEGTFRPEVSDKYTLAVEGDDGYRVYVNGEKVIDYWENTPVQNGNIHWSCCRKGL